MKTAYSISTLTDRDLMSPRHRRLFDALQSARMFMATDELLDINQVAERLGIPKGTVYELCRHRSRIHGNPLPHFKVGRRLKFNWSAVVQWIDSLEKAGAR